MVSDKSDLVYFLLLNIYLYIYIQLYIVYNLIFQDRFKLQTIISLIILSSIIGVPYMAAILFYMLVMYHVTSRCKLGRYVVLLFSGIMFYMKSVAWMLHIFLVSI